MAANTVMVRLDTLPESVVNAILAAAEAPNLPAVSSSDNGKILKVSGGKWKKGNETAELPTVTSEDNGKKLGVSGGKWVAVSAELPAVTDADDGKVLMVVDGAWAVASLPAET